MVQLVTRVDDTLAEALDELVASGSVASRSDAVRRGLEQLIDQFRRRKIGEQLVDGYVVRCRATSGGPKRRINDGPFSS